MVAFLFQNPSADRVPYVEQHQRIAAPVERKQSLRFPLLRSKIQSHFTLPSQPARLHGAGGQADFHSRKICATSSRIAPDIL